MRSSRYSSRRNRKRRWHWQAGAELGCTGLRQEGKRSSQPLAELLQQSVLEGQRRGKEEEMLKG